MSSKCDFHENPHSESYLVQRRKWIYSRIFRVSWPICMKFGKKDSDIALINFVKIGAVKCWGGVGGVNEIDFTRVPRIGSTFWILTTLTPNDPYRGRTAPLTSKRCILYIYSTNIGTEYFKHGIYSQFFSSKCSLFHNSNYLVPVLFTFYIQGVLKFKNISPAPKG